MLLLFQRRLPHERNPVLSQHRVTAATAAAARAVYAAVTASSTDLTWSRPLGSSLHSGWCRAGISISKIYLILMKNDLNTHWSGYYDQGKDFGMITSQMLSKILDYVNAKKTFLDIGCGTGQLSRELYHRGHKGIGIDVSESAIQRARASTVVSEDQLRYLRFNIEEDNVSALNHPSFGLITCKLVYAFIQNKSIFLKNVRNMLANDGLFVVITPIQNGDSPKSPIAVDHNQTLTKLQKEFRKIDSFNGQNVTYFMCQK